MEGQGIKFGLFVHIFLPLFLVVLTALWDEMFLMFHGLLSGREALCIISAICRSNMGYFAVWGYLTLFTRNVLFSRCLFARCAI